MNDQVEDVFVQLFEMKNCAVPVALIVTETDFGLATTVALLAQGPSTN